MKMSKIVLAAALAGAAMAASADQVTVTLPDTETFAGGVDEYFNNQINFTLSSATTLETTIGDTKLADGYAYLYSVVKGVQTEIGSPISLTTGFSDTFVNLKAGHYFYELSGDTSSSTGGYSITLSAVPEPASVALMVAGLGMMGFISRRRKN